MSDATITRTKFKTAITELVVNRGLTVDMHSDGDLIGKVFAKSGIKEFLETSREVEYFELTVSNGQWLLFVNEADGMELSDFTERHLDIVNLFSNELVEPAPVVHFRITTDNNSTWGLIATPSRALSMNLANWSKAATSARLSKIWPAIPCAKR